MSVNEKMTALADAIREKSGVTGKLTIDGMTSAVKAISSLIVASASGNPIVLSDSTDLRVQSLRLFGKTTQNGTPTPEAPVPLVSAGDGGSLGVMVAGKNLCPGYKTGAYLAASGLYVDSIADYYCTELCPVVPGAVYTHTTQVKGETFSDIHFFTKEMAWIGKSSLNADLNNRPDGTAFVAFNYWRFGDVGGVQVEVGSTATAYEPYKEPQTMNLSTPNGLPGIPVTSGGNYTDETGQQWICDEVDFGRGVYVQRIAMEHITTVTSANNAGSWTEDISQFIGLFKSGKANRAIPCMVTHGTSGGWFDNSIFYAQPANQNAFIIGGNRQKFGDTAKSCNAYLAELNAVSPVQMLYALETPIETPLSAEELAAYAALHTNYPNTTLLNDGGAGMEVQYVADTKLYIDNKINAMAAAIVNA